MHRDRPGDVAVIGGGLAGGLVALALAERGLAVVLVSAASLGLPTALGPTTPLAPATSWSYAGVLGPIWMPGGNSRSAMVTSACAAGACTAMVRPGWIFPG